MTLRQAQDKLRRQEGGALRDALATLDDDYDFAAWHWQPQTPPDYVCISAVLVQHTVWRNVERALANLNAANGRAPTLAVVHRTSEARLAELIRPAGTQRVKARRLLALARLAEGHGGIDSLLAIRTEELRPLLLETHGIGPETADAILLYAAGRPVFQVDAYAIRIITRLGLGLADDAADGGRGIHTYDAWQRWLQQELPPAVDSYRRAHALLVLHGKERCRSRPRCEGCCLLERCAEGLRQTHVSNASFSRTGGRASIPTR